MTSRTILVAEDNLDLQSLLRHVLEADGHVVHIASDGIEALDLFRSVSPDLVILDLMMPRLNGFEVLRRLIDAGERGTTPILILTARSSEDDVVTGFELGVDDYLRKPFVISELRARIRTLLGRVR